MNKLKEWLSNIFTESDNKTICTVKVLAIGSFLYAIGLHGYSIIAQHVAFDLQAFGTGWGIMMATLGAALAGKKDTPKDGA